MTAAPVVNGAFVWMLLLLVLHLDDPVDHLKDAMRGLAVPRTEKVIIALIDNSCATRTFFHRLEQADKIHRRILALPRQPASTKSHGNHRKKDHQASSQPTPQDPFKTSIWKSIKILHKYGTFAAPPDKNSLKEPGSSSECVQPEMESAFYSKGKEFWSKVPATIDGMLGGYSYVSITDVQASTRFLNEFFNNQKRPLGRGRALDCGAGIGRVSKLLLLPLFDKVDLVEQNEEFLRQVPEHVGDESQEKLGEMFCSAQSLVLPRVLIFVFPIPITPPMSDPSTFLLPFCDLHKEVGVWAGLQDFTPEPEHYDLIWCQWVTGYLTDEDLAAFLHRCKKALKPNGIIVIKDNLTSTGEVDTDHDDSSVTRPLKVFNKIYKNAGLRLLKQRKQCKFPSGLYEVKMMALQ
ncbi:NTMT1 [Cordylochernes scorpioides]|uniref:Alpha N-terminal protein methyltransferase 1 n=1 Tax=Cordylochernes scorpioides TaxID=51811 RepID=A0ABY6K356_9ARAC|nr:NTMT1 [Cordylochernes scorpioides]